MSQVLLIKNVNCIYYGTWVLYVIINESLLSQGIWKIKAESNSDEQALTKMNIVRVQLVEHSKRWTKDHQIATKDYSSWLLSCTIT